MSDPVLDALLVERNDRAHALADLRAAEARAHMLLHGRIDLLASVAPVPARMEPTK